MKSERRGAKRFPIRVLVNCLPADTPPRRNGHEGHGWEMWARDLGDDGVGLKWSLKWSASRCLHCLKEASGKLRDKAREICQSESPTTRLREGQEIRIDGLVYDDHGSQLMTGRIQWVRPDKKGQTVELGIHVLSPADHRSFFKALAG